MRGNNEQCLVPVLVLFALIQIFTIPDSLFAEVTLNSSFSVTETYTDNLFFESQRNKQDDFGTFVVPSVTIGWVTKDIELEGTYTGIAQFYVNNTSANAYSHNTNFRIDLPFLTKRYKGLEVRLIESFNFSPQLQGFAFSGEPGQESAASAFRGTAAGGSTFGGVGGGTTGGGISGLNGGAIGGTNIGNQGVFTSRGGSNAFQNTAGINVEYALSPRWTPTMRYINNYVTFTDPQLNDSINHQVGVGVGYQVSPRAEVSTNYSASFTTISGGDSFVSHSLTVGSSYRFSPTLNLSSNVGASFTESVSRVNFNTSTSIAKLFDQGSLTLNLTQAITPGGGLASSATLSRTAVLTANYSIAERVTGFLSGGLSENKSLSGNSVDVTSYQGQAGFSLILLEWLDGNISYTYIKQQSDGTAVGGRSATVNQIFLGLTASLPEWRIF